MSHDDCYFGSASYREDEYHKHSGTRTNSRNIGSEDSLRIIKASSHSPNTIQQDILAQQAFRNGGNYPSSALRGPDRDNTQVLLCCDDQKISASPKRDIIQSPSSGIKEESIGAARESVQNKDDLRSVPGQNEETLAKMIDLVQKELQLSSLREIIPNLRKVSSSTSTDAHV